MGDFETGAHPLPDLAALLREERPTAGQLMVLDHLAACGPCQQEFLLLVGVDNELREAAQAPFPQADELPALPALPPPELVPKRSRAPVRHAAPHRNRLLAAAAAVAVAVAVGTALWPALRPDAPGTGAAAGVPPAAGVPLVPVGALAGSRTLVGGEAHMEGYGAAQQMVVTVHGLAPVTAAHYELWLLDPADARMLAVGVLPPGGTARYPLPQATVRAYRAIEVSEEPNDGNPAHSTISLLRGYLPD